MRLGYSTWGMPTVPVDVALGHLRKLGFDGVELTVIPGYTTELSRLDTAERRRIRALLAEYRLALPAIAAHADLLVEDAALVRAHMAQLRAGVDLAVDLAGEEGPAAVNTTAGGREGTLE
jgi:sugar phosphate isomerase/epimerase